MSKITHLILLIFLTNLAIAEQVAPLKSTDSNGDVRLPLENYNQLVENGKTPKIQAPATYAIGQSTIKVKIQEHNDRTTALVDVSTTIKTFENKWTLIPLLPNGAAINKVTINGDPVALVQNAEWLAWSTNVAGSSELKISYTVDASRSESGYVVPVPIPRSASTVMKVEFPSSEIDLSIIPSSNLIYEKNISPQMSKTFATANIPTSSSVLIAWTVPSQQPYVMSRANYNGKLIDDMVTFMADYDVELFTGESVNVTLMPSSVTLNDIKIDDQSATIIEESNHFKVVLQGRGKHTIQVVFQAQVKQQQGPPTVSFPILRIPISQFKLTMNGKKEVSLISNNAHKHNVVNTIKQDKTTATVHVPMAESVQFSWVDAVPKDINTKLRANANIYHSISAEEGVLYGKALIDYEITHGETTSLTFSLPIAAQVNQINSPTAGISDWSVKQSDGLKTVTVFLDRAIKSNYQLQVEYEHLLQSSTEDSQLADINVPLIKANNMHRQRGIVALLAGSELTLKPIEELNITRVGENQLPAFFRNQITLTIAHTFKYTSDEPKLVVNTITPERKQGKYDAQVDTLISLGEVTMRGSSSLQIDVKSGVIVDLQLKIPNGVNILNVTGPSIRNHKVVTVDSSQQIEIVFTQEMTGQFRIELNYEKILGENTSELEVPSLQVIGTEVQHGRIAVEALTAVEVQTTEAKQLSSLEINELPQQLVLKTTNPILLAFKYVNTKSPHSLKLSMTRHQEIDVQVAAIESAHYQTLITNDGLSVTTAHFTVRNSRRQFLRLNLPENSEIWSVFVDGKPEKPALANDGKSNGVLIKMLNSVSGFPVEVIYATPIDKMGMFGHLKSQLPLPDMVVTHTSWDVYLPIGPNYQKVTSNMQITNSGQFVNPQQQSFNQSTDKLTSQAGKPLRMKVPQQGLKYSFEKLYANQSETLASFEIRYSSSQGNLTGLILSLLSVVLIWVSIFMLSNSKKNLQKRSLPLLIIGILGIITSIAYLNISIKPAATLASLLGLLFIAIKLLPIFRKKKL